MAKYKGLDCIVLIDDDHATNFIHKKILENSGLEAHIQVCSGGQMGLDYLNCEGDFMNESKYPQPGIILLDINMPQMDGWEFLEIYEQLPQERKAKIVVSMLTTSLNPDDRDKANQTPAINGFFNKPLEIEDIMNLINAHFVRI